MSELDVKTTLIGTRPFTPEEFKELRNYIRQFIFIELFVGGMFSAMGIGVAISLDTLLWERIILALGMAFIVILTGTIVTWDCLKAKKDIDIGKAEIHRGMISDRYNDTGSWKIIYLNGKRFHIHRDDWYLYKIGDEVSIEWAPTSEIVFKVSKVNHHPINLVYPLN